MTKMKINKMNKLLRKIMIYIRQLKFKRITRLTFVKIKTLEIMIIPSRYQQPNK